MLQIGEYQELKVNRQVDFGFYLGDGTEEVLLPNKYVPEGLKADDTIKVFVYKDSEDRPVATTLTPAGVVGDIVALTVKDETPHGSYMDWGLEKDLFVPRREQHVRFEVGKPYVIKILLDHKTQRVMGTSKLQAFIQRDLHGLNEGEMVDLLVYEKSPLGWKALINKTYSGLIYESEAPGYLGIGHAQKGYIHRLREDGKIDLRLSAEGRRGSDEGKEKLLHIIREHDGSLPLHDKSDPKEIFEVTGMSKKLFKKSLGALYRERLVKISPDGIELTDQG